MKFIGGSTTLIFFKKLTNLLRLRDSSPMNGSTVHQNLTMNNFHHTQIFSASSEIKILCKPIIKSSKIYFLLVIPKKMPCETIIHQREHDTTAFLTIAEHKTRLLTSITKVEQATNMTLAIRNKSANYQQSYHRSTQIKNCPRYIPSKCTSKETRPLLVFYKASLTR